MRIRTLILVAAAALLVSSPTTAAEDKSHDIGATAVGEFATTQGNSIPWGPTSWSDYMFVLARIRGGGVIEGDLVSQILVLDLLDGQDRFVAAASATVMTTHGHLTLGVSGWIDSATGEVELDTTYVAGSGKFEGATGQLHFHGWAEDGGAFAFDEISGSIDLERP